MVGIDDVRAAAARIAGLTVRTPSVAAPFLSRQLGAEIWLKLENLQPVGSFKLRGAANRLSLLTADERARGVVAMSAGNHAQGVARTAGLLGIDATIVMPRFTPLAKVGGTAAWGAKLVLQGENVEEAALCARHIAADEGRVFIHPYDDPAVVAGQGTVALEFLEDVPGLDIMVAPVGGGGLLAGCAVAARAISPATEVIGAQVAGYSALAQRLGADFTPPGRPTVAEGIAVKDIGDVPAALIDRHVRQVLTATETQVEDAIALLAGGAKQVAEGAGAVPLAVMLARRDVFAGKRVGLVVSGGNIDARVLSNVLLRGLLRDGRLLRLRMDIPDRPGVLADIAGKIAALGGNVIEVNHQRLFGMPSVQAAELAVMVEARDRAHGEDIVAVLAETYIVRHD